MRSFLNVFLKLNNKILRGNYIHLSCQPSILVESYLKMLVSVEGGEGGELENPQKNPQNKARSNKLKCAYHLSE